MMDVIDWDDAFENAAYIENAAAFVDRWASASAHWRETADLAGQLTADIPYGANARQTLDLFAPPGASQGLVVFVHGGYWHKFDKHYWSYLARGCVLRGWSVAIPSYRLAPHVAMTAITQDIRSAITTAAQHVSGPLRLTGHSAGGHLVTRMLCNDHALPETVFSRIEHVLGISGLYDLRPFLSTNMNDILGLTEEHVLSESPVLSRRLPLTSTAVSLWVGAEERPEFLRQTRLMCEGWGRQGRAIQAHYEPSKHHFDVIDGLAEPDSALLACLLKPIDA